MVSVSDARRTLSAYPTQPALPGASRDSSPEKSGIEAKPLRKPVHGVVEDVSMAFGTRTVGNVDQGLSFSERSVASDCSSGLIVLQTPSMKKRAWWALGLLVPAPSLGAAAAMYWWPESGFGQGLFIGGKIWLVTLPLAWRLWIDRERPSWSPSRRGGFGVASLLGAAIAITILLTFWVVDSWGWIDRATVGSSAAKTGLDRFGLYIFGAIYWITLNSLVEEYVWRWFVFEKFEVVWGAPAAVVGSALAFTAHHVVALSAQFNLRVTILGSLGVFMGGAVWSWLYLRYRSVWPCYVSHAIVDIPIFVIGYLLIF